MTESEKEEIKFTKLSDLDPDIQAIIKKNSQKSAKGDSARITEPVRKEFYYECPECSFRTKHEHGLNVHIHKMHKYECPHCQFDAYSKAEMEDQGIRKYN